MAAAPPSSQPQPAMADLQPLLQALVGVVQQLVGVLQSQAGAGMLGGAPVALPGASGALGGPAAATAAPAGLTPSSVQQTPITQTQQGVPPAAVAPAAGSNTGGKASFKVASFNTLGASHTSTGGNQHPTWKTGAARTPAMIKTLQSHDVDVAGLQEFQPEQQKVFRATNTGYGLSTEGANSIVWKTSKFDLVKKSTVTVPYFEGHQTKMPIVQLRDKATGKLAWFVNVHNPAETADHHHQGGYRAQDLKLERAAIDKLRATGIPVFLTGDLNDGSAQPKTALAPATAHAASTGKDRQGIDWILGTGNVKFSGYQTDSSPKSAHVSDHPIVTATATI